VFSFRPVERMKQIMRDAGPDSGGELREVNGQANHVHPPASSRPPSPSPWLANSLKGASSRRLRQEVPDLRAHDRRAKPLWSASYLAGPAGGAPITVLRRYIQQQDRPV
jgi:putative transposase